MGSRHKPGVLFRVRERDFLASMETVQYFPDSYLAWLVSSSMEDVNDGKPIYLDKQPSAFHKMLERTRWATWGLGGGTWGWNAGVCVECCVMEPCGMGLMVRNCVLGVD